jgi:conjugative relaxase-like TrwC/TraI family protein
MSLAKIGSGDGYAYYMRNIATNDVNDRGPMDLAGYYSERGETPGRWLGGGLGNLGLVAGEVVTEPQMRALIGRGVHPNAEAIIATAVAAKQAEGMSRKDAKKHALGLVTLGRAFNKYVRDEYSYRAECARAYAAYNLERGRVEYAPIPEAERARIRTEVAVVMFTEETGRLPLDDHELSSWVARAAQPRPNSVAGFDLTFTPVKSVSVLWGLSEQEDATVIEASHRAAVGEVIEFLENEVVFTRRGAGGVRQIEVEGGLIATAFDHRDSRAGDPNLHTHLVVSGKVLGVDGTWSSMDGRMLYRYTVAASELYNTRLEHHLEQALGLQFTDRTAKRGKRPVREVVGVDLRLADEWSKRGAAIDVELTRLTQAFTAAHGREPTTKELLNLEQRATLATRPAKPASRSEAEQRAEWRRDAEQILGAGAVEAMLAEALGQQAPVRPPIDVDATATQVVAVISETRATWRKHHVRAETERQLRGRIAPERWAETVGAVVDSVLAQHSIPRGQLDPVPAAGILTRSDGASVYTVAGAQMFTSPAIVAAEQRLVAASLQQGGRTIPVVAVDTALVEFAANHNGAQLNPGQQHLVREFACSGARFQVAIAPAGTGKTTAMSTLARAWTSAGGSVVGLAPTGAAAAGLAAEIDAHTATVDMLATLLDSGRPEAELPDWMRGIGAETLVILDEAAKTPTLKLDAAVSWLLDRGATIRAVGDDKQLSAVAAGGVIRDIVDQAGAVTLTRVVRFADPAEQAASLALRDGDPASIAYYTDHGRIHGGTLGDTLINAFRGWRADTRRGLDSAMLAPTRDLVTQLNTLARDDRLARTGRPAGPEVELADGLSASAGDVITTRRNDYRLLITRTDHVRNGYRWKVREVHSDGRITAAHIGSGQLVTLPAGYVAEHVQLGYAGTIDTAQGLTVDTCHGVLTGRESRAQAYVLASRARTGSHLYLATAGTGDTAEAYTLRALHPPTAVDMLTDILSREGTQTSATTADREARDPHRNLSHAVAAYTDALGAAAGAVLGDDHQAAIAAAAEQLVPGITSEQAWPVLRHTLNLTALEGRDLVTVLGDAVRARELDTADDKAAVLHWRIGHHTGDGPLPWLPAIPDQLILDPTYGKHLLARHTQIEEMADEITIDAGGWTRETTPMWATQLRGLDADLTGELAVWRAAHAVPDSDRRPTGPRRYPVDERAAQTQLDTRIAERIADLNVHTRRWAPLAREVEERLTTDPYWPDLAARLSHAEATGHDTAAVVRAAAAERPLPYEQPAAALHWRLTEPLGDAGNPDRIREFLREHPVRRLDDRQLVQAADDRRHQLSDPAAMGVLYSMNVHKAKNRIIELTDHYNHCLAQIQPLRHALAAEADRDRARHARRVAEQALAKAEKDYKETSKLRWRERDRLARLRDDARARRDACLTTLRRTEQQLTDAAHAVAGASSGWAEQLRAAEQAIADHPERLATATQKLAQRKQELDDYGRDNEQTREQLDTIRDEQRRRADLPAAIRDTEQALRAEITDPEDRHHQAWGHDFRPAPTRAQIKRAERKRRREFNAPGMSHDHGRSRGHGMGL